MFAHSVVSNVYKKFFHSRIWFFYDLDIAVNALWMLVLSPQRQFCMRLH